MARSLGSIKRGDTLGIALELKDGSTPILGIAASLKAQIRSKESAAGALLGEFTVIDSGLSDGVYSLVFEGDTRSWPSKVFFDIQWEDEGSIRSSDSFSIKIKEDITNG